MCGRLNPVRDQPLLPDLYRTHNLSLQDPTTILILLEVPRSKSLRNQLDFHEHRRMFSHCRLGTHHGCGTLRLGCGNSNICFSD